MLLSEGLAKRAMEYRMEDAHIRALGNLKLSEEEQAALVAFLACVESENWDAGYDDAMIDTIATKQVANANEG